MPYKDPVAHRLHQQRWQERNSEKQKAYCHAWYIKNKKWHNEYQRKYAKEHRAEIRERKRKLYLRLRQETIDHYGGRCTCCGESIIELLVIDHVNNDGAVHRKLVGRGEMFYYWLRRNGYPSEFQVLCWNCNAAKEIYGICPHKK